MSKQHVFGIALAGAIVLVATTRSQAQVSVAVGNPFMGRGVVVGGNPYGYGVPGTTFYNRGYSGVAVSPLMGSTGYAPVYGTGYAPVYGVSRPVYGYGAVAPRYYRNVYRGRGPGRRFYRW